MPVLPEFEPIILDINKQWFLRKDTCDLELCPTRQNFLHRQKIEYKRGDYSIRFPRHIRDKDGYLYCLFCKKIYRKTVGQWLVECPVCENFFKGPAKYFKVDYECEKCA